jgi:hypothetical protein
MDRSILIVLGLAAVAVAQDPFVPLDLSAPGPVLDQAGARQGWVQATNQRMAMAGRSLRVAVEDRGQSAVVLTREVTRPRQARAMLTGRGEHVALFKSVTGLGFTRMIVRNPETGQDWAARLERGRAVLEP